MTAPPGPGWFDDPSHPGQLRWWDGHQWTDFVHAVVPVARPGPVSAGARPIWPWLLALVVGGTLMLGLLVAIAVPTLLGARDKADDRVAWLNLERAASTVRPTLRPGFGNHAVTLPPGVRAANGESRRSYEISASLAGEAGFLAAHSASGHCWAMVLTVDTTTTGEVIGGGCTGESVRNGHFRVATWG